LYLILTVFTLAELFPIYWIIASSLKTPLDVRAIPPVWFPTQPTLENYATLFARTDILRIIQNSVIITLGAVLVGMFLGTPAAYAMSRFRIGGDWLPFLVLMVRMTPPVVFVLPFFIIATWFHAHNTYAALIIVFTFFAVPLIIWMMLGFFAELPRELEEAAMVDGCTHVDAFRRVILPLTMPGLAATAILATILVWNEFLFALILSGRDTRTLPVLVNSFVTEKSLDYGLMTAAGVIAALPVVLFGLLVQKQLVRGLTMGAIKG
jgi:multiple sugar transport system permease protein